MKYIIAILAAFLMSMAPQRADAQENTVKTMNVVQGNFGQGALMACYALPEDNQSSDCWIYNRTENRIGFHHPNGNGPMMYQQLDVGVTLIHLGVSDDGHFMTMILKNSASTIVEVHTLLRRETKNQRLAGTDGISTPRLYYRLVTEGAQSASVAKGNLMVLFVDSLKVYEMRPKVYLPMVGSSRPLPTPEPPPAGPRDTPEPFRCTGRSDDPPWCANRTPEPPPTPDHGPVVPTRTPEGAPCEEGPNCSTPPAVATARP